MEKKRSALLPLFRSEGQARLLAEAFTRAPRGGLRLTELAGRARISLGTAHREINRLEEAGILRSERSGRERRVRANEDSPYYAELRGLLVKAFGPAEVLGELLAPVEGVEEAFLFGSWARRYRGEPGEPPADLDVMVVGDPDPDDVYAACREAEGRAGLAVNPTILTRAEWDDGSSGFLRQIRSSALVPVPGLTS
jgi:hypothetical protein